MLALLASASAFLGAPLVARSAISCTRQATVSMAAGDLKEAEAEALAAVKKFGAKSAEAINAWETYEEIASADNSAASRPGLDEACEVRPRHKCCALMLCGAPS
jgi:hypothetical protein